MDDHTIRSGRLINGVAYRDSEVADRVRTALQDKAPPETCQEVAEALEAAGFSARGLGAERAKGASANQVPLGKGEAKGEEVYHRSGPQPRTVALWRSGCVGCFGGPWGWLVRGACAAVVHARRSPSGPPPSSVSSPASLGVVGGSRGAGGGTRAGASLPATPLRGEQT